jgi:hypothetical protein
MVLSADIDLESELEPIRDHLAAVEVWPFNANCVPSGAIRTLVYASDPTDFFPTPVSATGLPDAIADQITQFNLSIQLFWSRAALYAPEFQELAGWLSTHASDVADSLRSASPTAVFTPSHNAQLTSLVEINECLSILISQCVGVVSPILDSSFYPVGEYSLLGIGSVVRSVWRFYEHIHSAFGAENHLDALSSLAESRATFDADESFWTTDFSTWDDPQVSINAHLPQPESPSRYHIVYLGARSGFHQTMNTISVSWQCVQRAATPEWTILTFTHEFLHAHVRELLDGVLLPPDAAGTTDLIARFNGREDETFGDCARRLLVHALIRLAYADELLDIAHAPRSQDEVNGPSVSDWYEVTEPRLRYYVENYKRLMEEFIVHTMDFSYFYDGDETLFVSSLWRTWATVPTVPGDLSIYVLRTLVALSSTSTTTNLQRAEAAFQDASERMDTALATTIASYGDSTGILTGARHLLAHVSTGPETWTDDRRDLFTRFSLSFFLGRFTWKALVSETLHAELVRDRYTISPGPGLGREYRAGIGEYPDDPIESPVSFCLDRLRRCPTEAGDDPEEASLWQFLIVLEGGE